jgi:hypothetical protein
MLNVNLLTGGILALHANWEGDCIQAVDRLDRQQHIHPPMLPVSLPGRGRIRFASAS